MEQLLTVIREYKRARHERKSASARQDFELERLYNTVSAWRVIP